MADPRTTFLADQLQAEFLEEGEKLLEEALHTFGLCSVEFGETLAGLIKTAMVTGSTATIQVLMKHGRLRTGELQ